MKISHFPRIVLLAGLLVSFVGCSPATTATVVKDASSAIKIGDALCKAADTQPEPDWVTFTCSLVEKLGGREVTYTVRLPKSSFAAPTTSAPAASH
jgi:hypothetical protein